jgi:hypothetical protein
MTDTQRNLANDTHDALSAFGSSFNKKKTYRYSKEELLKLYEPMEGYFEGFTIWQGVSCAQPLQPINLTENFKVSSDAVC